jgi:formate C-acetyltransferase
MGMEGLATAVNSLAAVRWAVFEKRMLTLPELLEHLNNNFEGAEPLRQELARKPPKYGNDDRTVDEIADWVVQTFCDEVRKHRCGRGGTYRPLILSSGFQVFEGLLCKATPDGRRAGEPITDGISPAHGTELNGLTAVMHSAASAAKALVSDGSTLTLNLAPGLLRDDESIDKLISMLEAYFKLGGRQIQFTPVRVETLRDAQEHPDKYPDLSVKVSGYSAIFVDLPKSLQDDIIARTEFREV